MAPDACFSSSSDMNEFTKYSKFLVYKSVQVLVEARKGKLKLPDCNLMSSDTDWFNVCVPDCPEVNKAVKSILPSDRILETIRSKINVEISVQTEDGHEMVIEIWTFLIDDNEIESSLNTLNTIYQRMGLLLRSLISIARITPAYTLSRKQSSESFAIFYKLYLGEPRYRSLGENIKIMKPTLLRTAFCGIGFTVGHRTTLTISPHTLDKSQMLILKSDHFDLSPKHVIFERKKTADVKEKEVRIVKLLDLNKPLRLAAFVDEQLVRQAFEDFLSRIPIPKCRFRPQSTDLDRTDVNIKEIDIAVVSINPITTELPPRKFTGFRNENEPPMKLLLLPFADNHPIRELAEFFKEFFNAPYLKLSKDLSEIKSKSTESLNDDNMEMSSEDLSKDLEEYESSVQEFDDLIAEMCRSANQVL